MYVGDHGIQWKFLNLLSISVGIQVRMYSCRPEVNLLSGQEIIQKIKSIFGYTAEEIEKSDRFEDCNKL